MGTSILIIDDSKTVRQEIVQCLRDMALFDDYREAADGIDGLKSLLENKADLVICDVEMPRMDGFKFISMMRTRKELNEIPVIMLTGRGDREMKIKGLDQGACDYVTKPFDSGELVARVKVQLKIKALQDALRRSNQLLLELSNTDPLTGLFNRRYFMGALEKEFQRAQRKNGPLTLIILDIDHFKRINDQYGHPQGDQVLTSLAAVVQGELRRYDIIARYGGEEFIILLPETPSEEGSALAERLRAAVERMNLPSSMEGARVTISLGVSTCPSEGITSVYDLIREADEALYRAKAGGRNQVRSMAYG
ncbi:MAG TPA: diguanylate cyclase [Geobacteraceae bacterium]|nr:diguanylate cyclase [Geobacteraceae bacterium]